jgi:hypothetical protein
MHPVRTGGLGQVDYGSQELGVDVEAAIAPFGESVTH